MEVVGVYRESVFSPGRTSDDALILEETAAELIRCGVCVYLRRVEELRNEALPPRFVFSMAQGEESLRLLQQWQERGSVVVNRVEAVWNCRRTQTIDLCRAAQVTMPESEAVSTGLLFDSFSLKGKEIPEEDVDFSCGLWLKRADVHATQPDDVVFVENADALRAALSAFAQRGIAEVVAQRHCPGQVVKFYGVGPSRFFDCPDMDTSTCAQVADLASRAARAIGLEVFGGDCVLPPTGPPVLIDLNDWPSFARCRTTAVRAIADHLLDRLQRAL